MDTSRKAWCSFLASAAIGLFWSTSLGHSCDSPRTDTQGKPLRYEAVVEQQNGLDREWARILYDQGRFRVEYLPKPDDATPRRIELFDGGDPLLAWAYSARRRGAYPTVDSSEAALWREVKRLGEAQARQRYGIPPRVPIMPAAKRISPELSVPTLACFRQLGLRSAGRDKVAGFDCTIYKARVVPSNHDQFIRTRETFEASPIQTIRAWVEPRTELVLRLERHLEFPRASGAPPSKHVFLVKRLRLLMNVPLPRFQLPPGTTAYVPLIFNHVRLPAGVKRVRTTGEYAGTGIGYSHAVTTPPNPGK